MASFMKRMGGYLLPMQMRSATMESANSTRSWIEALELGDEEAAQRLFEEYFQRLAGLARAKLGAIPRRIAEPSDIVQSALNSFFQGVRRDAFPRLNDRDDLWRLLVVITSRKAAHAMRDENRLKRGGGNVRGESALQGIDSDFNGLQHVVGNQPTPEMAAIFVEELEHRLHLLDDETLRSIVLLKLEGCTNAEIAQQLGCVERTIERKLKSIRRLLGSSL